VTARESGRRTRAAAGSPPGRRRVATVAGARDPERVLEVTNTLTHAREPVAPAATGEVRMYTCGPTVYRHAHLGNLRTFLLADLARRVLQARGLRVRQVRNITDVGHMTDELFDRGEDKMLVAARLEAKSPQEIAAWYTRAFLEDVAALAILPADAQPRASVYVPQMIDLVGRLLERGHAYRAGGTVYFSVASFPAYGRLSGNSPDRLVAGHRVEVDRRKRHPADFVLWMAAGPNRLVKWASPWGEGYPGWHVECSAMLLAELGEHVDVHTGGEDLIFPHHEDEIAQSEAAVGHRVVRTWVHGAHLLAEQPPARHGPRPPVKMSKSAGNFIDLREVTGRGIDPLALRLLFLQTRYRSPLTFTWSALGGAATALDRWRGKVARWCRDPADPDPAAVAAWQGRVRAALEDDLHTPRALALLAGLGQDRALAPATRLAIVRAADHVLGLDLDREAGQVLPPGARELIDRRLAARRARDFAAADTLRDRLVAAGVELLDTPMGTVWRLHPPRP
jgi:cysteinyl-tRNA synthetase